MIVLTCLIARVTALDVCVFNLLMHSSGFRGDSVVVEAAFQHRVWSIAIPEWIDVSRTRIVLCEPNPEICAKRHLERGLADSSRERFHGDPRVRHFRETGKVLGPSDYEAPNFDCPLIKVNTEDSYEPSLEKIVEWLRIEKPNQTVDTTSASAAVVSP